MFNKKQNPKPGSKIEQQSVTKNIPEHYVQAYDLCLGKCLQYGPSNSPNIIQKSCFNRCVIKYTEALKFTIDYIKYQNHELKKSYEEHERQLHGVNEQGLLDKWHAIYNEHYGENGKEKKIEKGKSNM